MLSLINNKNIRKMMEFRNLRTLFTKISKDIKLKWYQIINNVFILRQCHIRLKIAKSIRTKKESKKVKKFQIESKLKNITINQES